MILKARKLTYLILLTICVYGAQAQPITLPQLVTESLLYKNQYSQLVNWTNLYQFLSRDDSNQHEYIENRSKNYFSEKVMDNLQKIISTQYLGVEKTDFDNSNIIPNSILFNHRNNKYTGWGWFIESLVTEVLVVLVIRTKKVPFFKSSPVYLYPVSRL